MNLPAWYAQVRDDETLPARCFVTAYTIGEHVNRKTGMAFPSQARLAALTKMNERSVREAIHALVRAGHLEIGTTGGLGRGNMRNLHTYRPLLPARSKPAETCRFQPPSKPEELSGFWSNSKPEDLRRETGGNLPLSITEPNSEPVELETRRGERAQGARSSGRAVR